MAVRSKKIIIAGTKHDRRRKIDKKDHSFIVGLHNGGQSINSIARRYDVSKRTIQFILFPERKEQNLACLKLRGGSSIYYDREKHTASVRKTKKYKQKLFAE